ncbi:hypothetical protein CQW23_23683 [Capsicum baccatum]|uniref:Myb/SANT-like domain-containing protein n=1 Tax=Capsicum baccatum TaxID=33114 RepID=A0A2G2VSR2_CAPBA|nr:hypothetical protein CQW23_23683 [Capsicum baccatum]
MSNANLVRSNAKWDYDAHIAFIEMCEREIRRGNRPNTHLNKDGWKNLGDAFYNRTGRKYTKTQLKNKWDNMKQDWAFFNQLIRENIGLGWDATKNTIITDDDWWNQKIKRYKRFRNMDLSLICYRYDELFSDIVSKGERARSANQEHFSEIEVELNKEKTNDFDDFDQEHFVNLNDKGSDESDDAHDMNSPMFPKSSLKRQLSTDDIGSSSRVKKSKIKSVREELHSIVELLSSKSSATSHAVEDPTIDKCMDFLASYPEIDIPSEIYNYTVNLFLKKDVHQIFLKMTSDDARKSWLAYNYQLYLLKKKE